MHADADRERMGFLNDVRPSYHTGGSDHHGDREEMTSWTSLAPRWLRGLNSLSGFDQNKTFESELSEGLKNTLESFGLNYYN